jgi:hypothetical protein
MKKSELRVFSYARDMTLKTDKFAEFDRMLSDARGRADAVLVTSPGVLGDSYDELVMNLNELATAGLMLIVIPPHERESASHPLN